VMRKQFRSWGGKIFPRHYSKKKAEEPHLSGKRGGHHMLLPSSAQTEQYWLAERGNKCAKVGKQQGHLREDDATICRSFEE